MEMDMCILLTILLFLNTTVQYARCDKINIIPTPETSCPSAIRGEPCFTLQQYIANPSFSSDITLELYPGNHHMDSQLLALNINSFMMRATETASVFCSQQLQPGNYYWFNLTRVQTVNVNGIAFNGCSMYLTNPYSGSNVTNATFVSSSFVNKTGGGILDVDFSVSLLIERCTFSDNKGGGGAISITNYGSSLTVYQSTFKNNSGDRGPGAIQSGYGGISILNCNFINNKGNAGAVALSAGTIIANSYFIGNVANRNGGAVYASNPITITNSHFTDNEAGGHGGAIYVAYGTYAIILKTCYFSNNVAASIGGTGGAVYIRSGDITVTDGYFSDNTASGHGGAIAINLFGNITVSSTTFIKNTAVAGEGGAIYSGGQNASIILLTNNTFSHNTAAYCGVLVVDDLYHYSANFTGNTFTHNRAVGPVAGNNGGGVICIGNASILVLDNNFSHNSAAGDAGVLRVDESDITVKGSIFTNNTAGGNGGVFHTYFYPTSYKITQTSFINNQAGGDGGVMYVGRAGSQVRISQSTFGVNCAAGRGGAITIAGSTLYINTASIYENTAKLGGVASACKSNVTLSNPKIRAKPDPVYPYCTLYDSSNGTLSRYVPGCNSHRNEP